PIGFSLAYYKTSGHKTFPNEKPICYKRKGPETFYDKFTDCPGNLFTIDWYNHANITEEDRVNAVWTDNKSFFSGGPFIQWSYNRFMGHIKEGLKSLYTESFSKLDGEVCVLSNNLLVNCNEKHYRYCFITAFKRNEDMSRDGCEDLRDFNYWRFWSPKSTCLSLVTPTNGRNDGVTWHQAQKLCAERNGQLLSTGWRYASSSLKPFESSTGFPFGIKLSFGSTTTVKFINKNVKIPPSDWHFKGGLTPNMPLGAVRDDSWVTVNSSYVFHDVICERPIHLRPISMIVSTTSEGKLELKTNETVNKNKIHCFTDAVVDFSYEINVVYGQHAKVYVLQPEHDGYYWCVHTDSLNYKVSESNKALFIRDKDSLINCYAVKLNIIKEHSKNFYDDWLDKLKQYIYYRTKYVESNYVVTGEKISETVLKSFKEMYKLKYKFNWTVEEVILRYTIKKDFFYGKPMLVHVWLDRNMKPVPPGTWDYLTVESMKPVYYCPAFGINGSAPIGSSVGINCKTRTCSGDFNEGVQWQTLPSEACSISTADEQLRSVIKDLKQLNSTDKVSVSDIEPVFDKVDTLLNKTEKINSQDKNQERDLLILLEQLGTKIDLNGSKQGAIIRNNIATVLADSNTKQPVRGFRIAAAAHDGAFTNDDFEIISDPKTTFNTKDDVVKFPESVVNRQQRISITVFRNDVAFQDTPQLSINSLILSVKVGNITKLPDEEVIEIQFSPLQENLERTQRPACVYWQFLENDTGFWSQEGCYFIRSTEKGILDTCRCNHLTHFARVLVSRDLFSQRDEDALELLSIIGCCLSIFGILMIGITAALFRSWRQDYSNKIWLQLCIAILLLVICFLVIVFAKFDDYNIPCILVGMLLHYSVLASFCWMLVAAVLSYRRLVIVFTRDASHKLLRASAFSWGVPCVIVGILFLVEPHSYERHFEEKHPSGTFCYPSGLSLWLTVYAPVALILLANWTLFVLIVRTVFAPKSIQRQCDPKESVRCAAVSCLLVFLFGLPWVFGLFAHNIVPAYIFALTVTFQGFILFLFFVVVNKKTRGLWLNKLKIKLTGKTPVVTLTYSDRSTKDQMKPLILKLTPLNISNMILPKKIKPNFLQEKMEAVILELKQKYSAYR
ncbi:uncharacterized protein LOC113237279, partial [Hyposmocoma kahamanoa]|uniref:uncharacterized protein LOC113237279 n=1 Tax=Hyposmocoma kahamanoa TaxID=1477025 RepID=UPI000E6D6C93